MPKMKTVSCPECKQPVEIKNQAVKGWMKVFKTAPVCDKCREETLSQPVKDSLYREMEF